MPFAVPLITVTWLHSTSIDMYYTDLEENGVDKHPDEHEEELFDEPASPQYPVSQSHHQHGLPDTRILLNYQLLYTHTHTHAHSSG